MRCPVRHRELTNYVHSETAVMSRARTALTTAKGHLRQEPLSSMSAVLGPTTVLRQKPFSFVKELNNALTHSYAT